MLTCNHHQRTFTNRAIAQSDSKRIPIAANSACRKIVSVVVERLKIDRNALGGENPKTSSAERGTIIVGDFYELQSSENFSFSVFFLRALIKTVSVY